MNIKKEIMEEWKDSFIASDEEQTHDAYPYNIKPFIHEEVTKFLSQALTRIEEETMEKALWCQFCGDELSCFGCEGIPGRTMEENRKLLLASLPPSEEKPLKDTDVPKKEKRGR